ncbi:hypothetical protein MTO96_019241 [Rhipicephalus appendiculatus]
MQSIEPVADGEGRACRHHARDAIMMSGLPHLFLEGPLICDGRGACKVAASSEEKCSFIASSLASLVCSARLPGMTFLADEAYLRHA